MLNAELTLIAHRTKLASTRFVKILVRLTIHVTLQLIVRLLIMWRIVRALQDSLEEKDQAELVKRQKLFAGKHCIMYTIHNIYLSWYIEKCSI